MLKKSTRELLAGSFRSTVPRSDKKYRKSLAGFQKDARKNVGSLRVRGEKKKGGKLAMIGEPSLAKRLGLNRKDYL